MRHLWRHKMKLKRALLLPALLLSGCYQSYMADHTLKQAWSQDLENTQPSQIPYALVYDLASKKLIYVAATADNKKQSNAIIESLIQKWRPQVVLIQGHPAEKTLQPSEIQFHLMNHKPILKGASADRQQILENLEDYGITERDYTIYQVINLANQNWQFDAKSPQDLQGMISHFLKTDSHAKKFNLTYKDIQIWFHQNIGMPLTHEILVDGEIVAPKDPQRLSTNILQKIATYEDEIDDAIAMDALSDELDEKKVVMIIRAPSKFVTERSVLHKMIGVSKPTEIVN